MNAAILGGLKAEMNRLVRVRNEYPTEDEWLKYIKGVFGTLIQFELIQDYHIHYNNYGITLNIKAPKDCFEVISASIRL